MLRMPGLTQQETLRKGDYMIMRIFEDTLFLSYSEPTVPPKIYSIHFKQVVAESLDQLIDSSNLDVNIVEELSLTQPD